MGLDNGIVLRFKTDPYLPSYVKLEKFDEGEYEVCYWRKCQGIRHEILCALGKNDNDDDEPEYDLTPNSLKKIRDIIYDQLSNPDDWYSSIWDMDEMVCHLGQDIVNLSWLIKFMKDEPHATAYFYDSY